MHLAEQKSRFDRWFDSEGSVRALCLLRILVGPIVILHLTPFLREMADGIYYGNQFYHPWFSWFPEVPKEPYFALLCVCVVAAVLMSVGLLSRAATIYCFAFVTYNFFLSETHFRHNRNFLIVILAGLSLFPVGRALSLDALIRRWRGRAPLPDRAPLWPLWLLRFLVCLPYLASGFSKLIDVDWWGGVVTWDRVVRFRHHIDGTPLPQWAIDLVTSADFHYWFAKGNIMSELYVGLALWFRRTRLSAVFVAAVFHTMIEITASVQVFSYLGLSALLIWATPGTRDRRLILDPERRGGRALSFLVRRFDWLARFEVEPRPGHGTTELVGREGWVQRGPRATRTALSRLPVLALAVAPTLVPGVATLVDRIFGVSPDGGRQTATR